MKERRGTVARLAGLAEGVAAAARRRQRERSPRVTLYDADGHPRLLAADTVAFDEIVAAAERMLAREERVRRPDTDDEATSRPPSTRGVSVPPAVEQDQEAEARGGTRDKG